MAHLPIPGEAKTAEIDEGVLAELCEQIKSS
jgi:hypothetical protein